jgi:hypothetical protein
LDSDVTGIPEDMPEMTSLSNRFSFFEKFEEKEAAAEVVKQQNKQKHFRMTPPREGGEEQQVRMRNLNLFISCIGKCS